MFTAITAVIIVSRVNCNFEFIIIILPSPLERMFSLMYYRTEKHYESISPFAEDVKWNPSFSPATIWIRKSDSSYILLLYSFINFLIEVFDQPDHKDTRHDMTFRWPAHIWHCPWPRCSNK